MANGIAAAATTTARRSARACPTSARSTSIAQSWSVLSGRATRSGRRRRCDSATQQLVDDELEHRQAVHAALRQDRERSGLHQELSARRARERRPIHACRDLVRHRAGRDRAWPTRPGAAFCMLNPVNHALDAAAAERYRVEPYVVAADIYSAAPQGRARRLDLVHGLGRLALPRCRSRRSSASASRVTTIHHQPGLPDRHGAAIPAHAQAVGRNISH